MKSRIQAIIYQLELELEFIRYKVLPFLGQAALILIVVLVLKGLAG